MSREAITLAHGSGGKLTRRLIETLFFTRFANDVLCQANDAAQLEWTAGRLAFTTDSYVITPRFFRGGDIGKLSICGTVNDLVTSGARPVALSCGMIIEDGFSMDELERIVASMAQTAASCGVKIVTGDTKVVPKGAVDGLFINTAGIGVIPEEHKISAARAQAGDAVIVTGSIGDHGCSIMLERDNLMLKTEIESDCAPLNGLMETVFDVVSDVHVLRDPTRGGVATALHEIASQSGASIVIYEDKLPIKPQVQGVCELLGMDPLYMANEGKMILIIPAADREKAINALHNHPLGREARVIGEVRPSAEKPLLLRTMAGGIRIVEPLTGDQLPRIC